MRTIRSFAISAGDCVEIRVAKAPPKKVTSKITKFVERKIKKQIPCGLSSDGYPKYKNTEKIIKEPITVLSQTAFVGGRIVGVIGFYSFTIACSRNGIPYTNLINLGIMEITKTFRTQVLKEKKW